MKLNVLIFVSLGVLVACGQPNTPASAPSVQTSGLMGPQGLLMPPPHSPESAIKPDSYLVTFRAGVLNSAEVQALFSAQGFDIVDVMEPDLNAAGPCGRLAYGLSDRWYRTPAQIMAALETLKDLIFGIDPLTGGVIGGSNQGHRPLPDPIDGPDPQPLPLPAPPEPAPFVDHLGALGAQGAWARGWNGSGVTIAVLDTGISPHSALAGKPGWTNGASFTGDDIQYNLTDHLDAEYSGGASVGHGTGVAGLAAGITGADGTATGVASGASVLDVRVCDRFGRCRAADVLKGLCHTLKTVADPANLPNHLSLNRLVINMSFGGDQNSTAVYDVLKYALSEGALVVTAGGNEGGANMPAGVQNRAHFPAAAPGQNADDGLVAVAALTLNPETNRWQRAAFSTGGSYLDIAAPGVNLKTASAEDRAWYSAREGTSFATPLVSGALAILRQAHPTWSSAQIEAVLKAHALPLAGESLETVGAGMLNLRDLP